MRKNWSDSSNIGKLSVLIGLFVIVPLITLPWFRSDIKYAAAFLIPGICSVVFGMLICVFGRRENEASMSWKSQTGRSSLTVLFAWSWGPLIAAVPFVLGKQLQPLHALFESISGWTTTGMSVMEISEIPGIYVFYRSFMQYCGGLGFILMMIIFISNRQSMNLYNAEGHPDKIMPNIRKTALAIFTVYNICLILGSIAYRIAGMTWFDSICNCMCALSTGGFSLRLMGISEYDSFAIEIITIILMLISATNFTSLLLLAKGRIRSFFRVSDVKLTFILLAVFIPPVAVSLSRGMDFGIAESFRKSMFASVSALSCAGMVNMNYAECPPFVIGILILLMLIGGQTGSASGGIKISRVYLLLRQCGIQIRKRINPDSYVESPHYVKASGKTPIDRDIMDETISYLVAYLIIYLAGSLIMTVTAGCSLTEALFDFASALGSVGLSMGITGPMTNNATLIVEMIGMMLGRLEIFIVIIGIKFGFDMIRNKYRKRKNN